MTKIYEHVHQSSAKKLHRIGIVLRNTYAQYKKETVRNMKDVFHVPDCLPGGFIDHL